MNRGCKAIATSGRASSVLLRDGMTRAPVVRFGCATRTAELKLFLENPENFENLSAIFNRSSRFARLQSIRCAIAGKNLYMRFSCSAGVAMGMNMVSKGVQNVLDYLQGDFPDMDVMGISGNFCSDKKPAAVNWIEGRGKSVVCEALIKGDVVRKILTTSVKSLVELNMIKNLTGSAMAGALGGFNTRASNIVSAVYIATGQDPARFRRGVSKPAGGERHKQGSTGRERNGPGKDRGRSVLAGEMSLMSAISAGQLVKYYRSSKVVSKVSSS
ncbi:hypothetical protein MLD38_023078 [Melastoma candidum]|uniref:Uncharacterized protein n=1 Tax=Melastoma candidum TaxID=119954 RepID=A0ACB9QUI6_9MYRT|nr:hypothetical protein MLD38_023078 [Melastoma candidum]